jgi:hypothetical protein
MFTIIFSLFSSIRQGFRTRAALHAEILAPPPPRWRGSSRLRRARALPKVDSLFAHAHLVFEECILGEISNVISDVQQPHPDLRHRGHVIAIALMCALDAIASYGYRKHHVADFIRAHFHPDYHPHADQIYVLYRCSLVQAGIFSKPQSTPTRRGSDWSREQFRSDYWSFLKRWYKERRASWQVSRMMRSCR